jgi:hypothetical protein
MMQNNETPEVEFYFIVGVEKNGSIQTFRELPEGMEAERPFTTLDIYKVCQEIVSDIKDQILADRVITGLMNVMQAQQQPVSARVADALKERGVEFDAGSQTLEFSAEDAEIVEK